MCVHFLLLDSPEHCNIATAVLSTGHDIYCYQKYRIFLLLCGLSFCRLNSWQNNL